MATQPLLISQLYNQFSPKTTFSPKIGFLNPLQKSAKNGPKLDKNQPNGLKNHVIFAPTFCKFE